MDQKNILGILTALVGMVGGYLVGTVVGNFLDKLGASVLNILNKELVFPSRGCIIVSAAIAVAAALILHWTIDGKRQQKRPAFILCGIMLAAAIVFTILRWPVIDAFAIWYVIVTCVAIVLYIYIIVKYDPVADAARRKAAAEEVARRREEQLKAWKAQQAAAEGKIVNENGEIVEDEHPYTAVEEETADRDEAEHPYSVRAAEAEQDEEKEHPYSL